MTWKLRNAGSRWRLLVHERQSGTRISSMAYDIRSFGYDSGSISEFESRQNLPNTEFDELVVGQWCHIEQMDTRRWHINIGGCVLMVDADRDGRPRSVAFYRPGEYADPVVGCMFVDGGDIGDGL